MCHAAFARQNNLHFPLLSDFEPKGEVARKYGAYRPKEGVTERALFVIDEEGKIPESVKDGLAELGVMGVTIPEEHGGFGWSATAYCRMMEEWSGAWRSWRIELEDVIEVALDKVLVTGRHIGVGLASGAEIEQWGAVLYTFRRGRILRVDVFFFADKDTVSEIVTSIADDARVAEQNAITSSS